MKIWVATGDEGLVQDLHIPVFHSAGAAADLGDPVGGRLVLEDVKIVCLCGSTRFKKAYERVNAKFTKEGWIVLAPGVFKGEQIGNEVKEQLDELHLRKIDLADLVYVVNVDGYMGESTKREIEYARKCGKEVQFLCPTS